MAKQIHWAPREKRRAVNAAVGNSFLKTVTEPFTNSDSNLKTQSGVRHAAGLIGNILNLKSGEQLNSAELKKRIPEADPRRIRLEVCTVGANARVCRVIDQGTGMSSQELEEK